MPAPKALDDLALAAAPARPADNLPLVPRRRARPLPAGAVPLLVFAHTPSGALERRGEGRAVSGRRRLRAGAPRLLGRHDGPDGAAFRTSWMALTAEFGTPTPGSLLRLEMGRVAVAWTTWRAATTRLTAARRLRACGKGRRPSTAELSRLEKRAGLADASYAAALDKLRELVARAKSPPTIAALVRRRDSTPEASRRGGEAPAS